jgi:uncharacterized protein YjiS (DUF1127 family)
MTLAITLVGPTALIVVLIARNRARMAAWLFKSAGGARKRIIRFMARLKHLVNGWVAAAIARYERRVAKIALHQLDDRELKDIGIYRGEIDEIIERAAQSGLRRRCHS